jgi:hypothetical protein
MRRATLGYSAVSGVSMRACERAEAAGVAGRGGSRAIIGPAIWLGPW